MKNIRYFIGIDGGGTKTAIRIADGAGQLVSSSELSGLSWREHGVVEVAQKLFSAIAGAISAGADTIGGIAAGLPCYGESAAGDRDISDALAGAFLGVPLYLCNDVEVGWAGSLALRPGINVVAGTGSIAFGVDVCGNKARCGGWDEFYSDEGSCHWIGRELMGLFAKQADFRLERGPLYAIIREQLGIADDFDFIDKIRLNYFKSRSDVARFQILAEQSALAGDDCALSLYRCAAEELAMLVKGIARQLDFPKDKLTVSYSGGLFKAGTLILEPFEKEVRALGGSLVKPKLSPVTGALMLAFREFFPEKLELVRTEAHLWDKQ